MDTETRKLLSDVFGEEMPEADDQPRREPYTELVEVLEKLPDYDGSFTGEGQKFPSKKTPWIGLNGGRQMKVSIENLEAALPTIEIYQKIQEESPVEIYATGRNGRFYDAFGVLITDPTSPRMEIIIETIDNIKTGQWFISSES